MTSPQLKLLAVLLSTLLLANCGGGEESGGDAMGGSGLGPTATNGDVFTENSGSIAALSICPGQPIALNLTISDIRNDPNRADVDPDGYLDFGYQAPHYTLYSGYQHDGENMDIEPPLEVDFEITNTNDSLSVFEYEYRPKEFKLNYSISTSFALGIGTADYVGDDIYTLKKYTDDRSQATFFDNSLIARTDDSQTYPRPGLFDYEFPQRGVPWLDKVIVLQVCGLKMRDGEGNIFLAASNVIAIRVKRGF